MKSVTWGNPSLHRRNRSTNQPQAFYIGAAPGPPAEASLPHAQRPRCTALLPGATHPAATCPPGPRHPAPHRHIQEDSLGEGRWSLPAPDPLISSALLTMEGSSSEGRGVRECAGAHRIDSARSAKSRPIKKNRFLFFLSFLSIPPPPPPQVLEINQ